MTGTLTRRVPADQAEWVVCAGCRDLIYGKRLSRSLGVCPECGRHRRVDAPERISQLLDPGSAELLGFRADDADPLGFVDSKPYRQRLAEARRETGLDEAVLCARGTVEGQPVVVAVMDFRFMGGSLGSAVGELITQAVEEALHTRTPLLVVTASGGARMQEGALSLMQMAKTSQAFAQLDEAGVFTVSLITDPTFGGVAASFASLADVLVAEPGARMGFAGRRVIEQTIREELPADFQTAEFLLGHGLADLICPRGELRSTIARLLSTGNRHVGASGPAAEIGDALVRDPAALEARDPWQAVRSARALDRPTARDYFHRMLDEFVELHGDRLSADSASLVGGLGRLGGIPVLVLGHQKGHDASELAAAGFGMPQPSGYRKSARLMRIAAKLGLPVIALVDTPGAHPGVAAEEQGQAIAIAENLRLMAGLPVPIVAVVTGEGGSGGALALAVADAVLMWEHAVYSVISPEGCAAILWKDAQAAPKAAAALGVSAERLLGLGVVDAVIREPSGGVQADHHLAAERLRAVLLGELGRLAGQEQMELLTRRHARFRRFGAARRGTDSRRADGGLAG
ncbi:acetyl-CoA carboxylase, carboxyltransferase subunit beta [Amycolatopsis circi]|uniref:acetyl-CoA carboxylase, carboxyltransferase subunit beta n=1 Tax=Amycolatopsis circi TaxID=871959 RepID=UPI000E281327|nr:acetyl-CoA carboxylase, carboxyltransferase subunit beta [Amycolatopsis circi]